MVDAAGWLSGAALRALATVAPDDTDASVSIEDPARRRVVIGNGAGSLRGEIRVRDRRAYAAVLACGSTGLAESYARGWWDSDDLTTTVRALLRLTTGLRSRLDRAGRSGAGRLVASARSAAAPDVATDRLNIASHYDLSNELFALMLDPTMTYSCGVFAHRDDSLETAQLAKIDRLAAKLDIGPGDHVVEIGTGWGGSATRLAQRYGCRVTTTTISEAQRAYAVDKVRSLGLEGRVTVLGSHYRDLRGTYDALISVEMIEAVNWRHHDDFFAHCARLLTAAGRMGLQAITMADGSFDRAKQHRDFIRRLVFPGGCIPSVASMAGSVARTGDLRVVDLEDIGLHYGETLRRWQANFGAHGAHVEALGFDESFRRLWMLYLCYCEAAFTERHISVVQLVLARPAWVPSREVRPC